MPESKQYGLGGLKGSVELGKGGARVRNNGGVIESRNNADDALAVMRAAAPVNDDDLVTKKYLETRAQTIVTGQINGGAPPVVVAGAIYVCTTAGGGYSIDRLYRGEGGNWVDIFGGNPPEGLVMKVTDNLTGGTHEFLGDHLFIWDEDNTEWDDIGPDPYSYNYIKTVKGTLTWDAPGTVNLGLPVPTGSIVLRVIAFVEEVFDGDVNTLTVGDAGDADRHMTTDENDLTVIGKYLTDQYYNVTANFQITATLVVTGTPSAGTVHVIVEYRNP